MPNDLDLITQLEQELGTSIGRIHVGKPQILEEKNGKRLVSIQEIVYGLAGYRIDDNQQIVKLVLHHLKSNFVPQTIFRLTNLTQLALSNNQLTTLPPEFGQLTNLTDLDLSENQLTTLPSEIGQLTNLMGLNLRGNQLTTLPPEIGRLTNLTFLALSMNRLTTLPPEIIQLKNLVTLELEGNPLKQPPPEIVKKGVTAIFEYLLWQLAGSPVDHSEAKLILVGQGDVGKTCLAKRLLWNTFAKQPPTEGIDILHWPVTAPTEQQEEIALNVWDFGGQEIYHATHQFFLTKRSVYLLVWNARKSRDYDHIYYWLHTIEAFGEDSPVILVMTKCHERDDDLNLKDLKDQFPQIVGLCKVDSADGKGIPALKELIRETAWNLPHIPTPWIKAWFNVRERLEQKAPESLFGKVAQTWLRRKAERDWITCQEFDRICAAEGLDRKQTEILDEYLHDLGIIIHFRDRLELRNMVILKPEWATNAVYKVLDTRAVREQGGILLHSELEQIWPPDRYSPELYPQLLELMNKFELAYRLPDGASHLVAELLPSTEPDFAWDSTNNLRFYYRYDFLPAGVMTRFIVRVHQDLELLTHPSPSQEGILHSQHLCWREGAVLQREGTRAFVKVKPVEKLIEIRISGDKKRELLAIIRREFDHINRSIKKIEIAKEIPCNCSAECPNTFNYDDLLAAEREGVITIQCQKRWKNVELAGLLEGYERRETRIKNHERLQQQWDLCTEKLSRLEKRHIVENDESAKFKLEREIAALREERQRVEEDLKRMEARHW
jgi:internalin A